MSSTKGTKFLLSHAGPIYLPLDLMRVARPVGLAGYASKVPVQVGGLLVPDDIELLEGVLVGVEEVLKEDCRIQVVEAA